jgi:exodeoxyribonuclease VII large subunit
MNFKKDHSSPKELQGELTNLSIRNNACYFCLKDEISRLDAVMWNARSAEIFKDISEGDRIVLTGGLTTYGKFNKLQFRASSVKLLEDGVGQYEKLFQEAKNTLEKEGLTGSSLKKAIPAIFHRVAIVTSERGAALPDMLSVFDAGKYSFPICSANCLVQGDSCAKSVKEACESLLKLDVIPDILVVCRGGGSREDLWGFNDLELCRYLRAFPIPVITAIGHQVDTTLVDLVSDVACITPTAAAQFLLDRYHQISETQVKYLDEIQSYLRTDVDIIRKDIEAFRKLATPERVYRTFVASLSLSNSRIRKHIVASHKKARLDAESLVKKSKEHMTMLEKRLSESGGDNKALLWDLENNPLSLKKLVRGKMRIELAGGSVVVEYTVVKTKC